MKFAKASAYVGAVTVSKLALSLITVKVMAWSIGAEGLGQVGQFMSLMVISASLAGGGLTTGVIRYVAESKDDSARLISWTRSASALTCIYSILYGSVLLVLSTFISETLFQSDRFSWVIKLLGVAQVGMACANLLQGTVNGFRRSDLLAFASGSGAVLATIGLTIGCYFWGLQGAMVGLIWASFIQVVPLAVVTWRGLPVTRANFRPKFDKGNCLALSRYSLMAIATACTLPAAEIFVRGLVEADSGWASAGQWQGMLRLSGAYLQFVNILLLSFYLPKLAEQKTRAAVVSEVKRTYRAAVPFLLTACTAVYLFRDVAISVLYTEDFRAMRDLFSWQLTGDFFKILAYVSGCIVVARGSIVLFILAEILQGLMFCMFASFLVPDAGPVGAVQAYALTYFIYFIVATTLFIIYIRRTA